MAFYNCYKLNSIPLPEGLESIGFGAFFRCFGLQEVVIPKSVKTIGEQAFGMCQHLQHVLIPKETMVAKDAFIECPQGIIEYY